MHLYRGGDRSAGVCERCKCQVNTRMEFRDYRPAEWPGVVVPDVLLGVCEACDGVVSIPAQSMPRINEHRPQPAPYEPIQGRVPRVVLDALDLVAAGLGGEPKVVRPAILRYYLGQVTEDPEFAKAMLETSADTLASTPADHRLSVKVPPVRWAAAWAAAQASGFTSVGQLLRGAALMAARDFRVTFHPQPNFSITHKPVKGAPARLAFLKDLAKSV